MSNLDKENQSKMIEIKEKGLISSSPGCSFILLKSIEEASALAGVPVLNLLIGIPRSRKF